MDDRELIPLGVVEMEGSRRTRSAERKCGHVLDVLPPVVTIAYVVIGLHGLLSLAGWEMVLAGPPLPASHCVAAAGVYLIRWFHRRQGS